MSIKIKDNNRIPEYKKIIKELCSYKIRIGIFASVDSDLVKIAAAHEFGANIKPRNGRFLTIPVNKKAKGKNPRDFADLFVLKADSGELFLAKEKGKSELEFYYWLARSVVIPERSFIRSGFDESLPKIEKRASQLVKQVLSMEISPGLCFDLLGEYIVGQIKDYMTNLDSPPNSTLTKNMKGSSSPLIDSGRLRQSISYKVVKA
jgi:hypothetical protein